MSIALHFRIALCALSGIGVAAIEIYGIFGYHNNLGTYGASGLLFAAGVLFPYLKRNEHFWLRAAVLVVASALSYYCAVWLVTEVPLGALAAFTIGSVAGAGIVLATFAISTRARISVPFASFGLAAGLVGGPITWFTIWVVDSVFLGFAGYAIWHTLISLAIHLGLSASSKSTAACRTAA